MHPQKLEKEDTTKFDRKPRNLLEFISDESINESFFPLLAKHHKKLQGPLKYITEIPELKDAAFVIDLNGFYNDLAKISEICFKIENEVSSHKNNIERHCKALRTYSSEDLSSKLISFYGKARTYDKYFQLRHFYPKLNGRPFLPMLLFFKNPFYCNKNISNEENILNLISAFKIHENFFIKYLNVLYGDGEDGEEFTGEKFEIISYEYKKIKNTISDVLKIIPEPASERVAKSIELKRRIVEKTIEKYPATLYLATKKLLDYFENTAARPIALQSGHHP